MLLSTVWFPLAQLALPPIFQMLNGEIALGVVFIFMAFLLIPTIIGPFLVYFLVIPHGFLLRATLRYR